MSILIVLMSIMLMGSGIILFLQDCSDLLVKISGIGDFLIGLICFVLCIFNKKI